MADAILTPVANEDISGVQKLSTKYRRTQGPKLSIYCHLRPPYWEHGSVVAIGNSWTQIYAGLDTVRLIAAVHWRPDHRCA